MNKLAMNGKICLVTGANAGIGKETCMALASKGAEVVMSARNFEQAEEVRKFVISQTGNSNIHLMIADLSDPQEVATLSDKFQAKFQKLDVLINNAAIFLTDYIETPEGIETQWMVNYLAPYLLTRRLMNCLMAAPEARIINVSSNAHLRGSINFADLNRASNYQGFKAYAQSKLGNILFTKSLSVRLAGTAISSYAVHPGVVSTGIGNKYSHGWLAWLWRLGKPFMISPARGAATIVYLAAAPQIQDLSGLYFVNCRPHTSSPQSTDPEIAKRLWEVSESMIQPYLE
ncbi:MAG: short-chain dehydrogenase [Cyclobacteriaceae bacterium]|nr:MAG: short-chain dehydrogenase [Cyclobacteriaceae bacterium]